MKSKGIKNLLIDLGGVLANLDRQRFVDNFQKLGLVDAEKQLDIQQLQGFFLAHEKGLITSEDFRNEIRNLIGKPVDDEQIDAAWNSLLVEIPSYKLELLLELRTKYVVYLLSNTNALHWDYACKNLFPYRTFRVEDYFEKAYLSFELHQVKPDMEIFQSVLQDAGIEAKETLFIDDSRMNCRAAEELGIVTYTAQPGEDWSHLFIKK